MSNATSIGLSQLLLAVTLAVPMASHAAPILYGVSLNGATSSSPGPSSLYTIDPVTGAGSLVGSLGHAVNAIAMDPTSGKLYGSTTSWSGAFNGLLEIDPLTGATTEIGAFGAGFTSILGLTFNSSGDLFGWHDPSADDPVSVNLATGAATTVGDSGVGTAAHVLAFDASDVLKMVDGTDVYDINTTTGTAVFNASLSFDPGYAGAAFDPTTGLLWASRDSPQTLDSFIRVTNLAGDSFSDIDTDIEHLSAVTWGSTITAVPEPGSLALLGLGLAGLLGSRLRKR